VLQGSRAGQGQARLRDPRQGGRLWLDNKGKAWVDSYNKKVWDYNIAIAREAVELGFAEVQWDYVRFPDAPRSYLERAVYTTAAGRAKEDAIREFMLYARQQLADLKVPITADVFGLTVTTAGDMGIGQRWEKMVDAVDVILPMVYPSHFIRGNYGLSNPNAAPYRTIQRSMEDAMARSQPVANAASIRPWLQAFTLGPPRYTPAYVWAQIQAVYDVGLKEWVLWNPGSNYDPAALHPKEGPPPEYEIPVARARRASRSDTLKQPTGGAKSDTMTVGSNRHCAPRYTPLKKPATGWLLVRELCALHQGEGGLGGSIPRNSNGRAARPSV
jgi:hypothetical protein